MVQSLASKQANNVDPTSPTSPMATQFVAAHHGDDFAPAGTRFTPAEIDELVQARTASLLIQTSQLERRTALIQSRAEEAEARVVALKAEAAQHQFDSEAAFAKAEREAADRILALEVDLASARQRTNVATQELMGFGSEISAIRDTNAKHLQSVHETMRDLQHRLDTTKAALAGRSMPAAKPSSLLENPSSSSPLMALPGMTALVVDSLSELGISTLEDVASWTDEDVDHIQSLLPEDPEIVERNGWVTAAQRALSSLSASTES
jgi:predicted flap endonuclease-1-like 5' DNA nuclease